MLNSSRLHIVPFTLVLIFICCLSGCSTSSSDDTAAVTQQQTTQTGNENNGSLPDPTPVVYPDYFLAGANVSDITPTDAQIEEGVFLGGFGMVGIRKFDDFFDNFKTAKATGIHDPIYARAFVAELKGEAFAFVILDVCVIGNRVINEITAKVSKATMLPAKNIFIGATHSHASLDLLGYMGGACKSYRTDLINKTADAVISAYKTRVPARLYVSSVDYGDRDENGRVIRGTGNRRGWPDLPGHPDVDRSLNVVEARSIDKNETIGMMINLGCHPTLISADIYDVSRDFCGYLVDRAEALTGAPVVFVQGAMGDARPNGWGGKDDYEVAKNFGENVAESAVKSLDNQVEIEKDLYISTGLFNVKLTNILLKLILNVAKSKMELDYNTDTYEVQTKVNYIRLGRQLQIATLPGEVVTHLSLGIKDGEKGYKDKAIEGFTGIKEGMSAPYKMVCGITGDTLLYLVPEPEWNLSPDYNPNEILGYEEMMCINKDFAALCAENAFDLMRADEW